MIAYLDTYIRSNTKNMKKWKDSYSSYSIALFCSTVVTIIWFYTYSEKTFFMFKLPSERDLMSSFGFTYTTDTLATILGRLIISAVPGFTVQAFI